MRVNINELRERSQPLLITRDFLDRELQVANDIMALKRPVHAQVGLSLVGDQVKVEGQLTAELVLTCSRCLVSFEHQIRKTFQLSYSPDPVVGTEGEEIGLSYAELEMGFYRNEELDLSGVISEQIFLEIPMKPVCREDCKGLCDQCGTDLNESRCNCQRRTGDPRFAALLDVKKRLTS